MPRSYRVGGVLVPPALCSALLRLAVEGERALAARDAVEVSPAVRDVLVSLRVEAQVWRDAAPRASADASVDGSDRAPSGFAREPGVSGTTVPAVFSEVVTTDGAAVSLGVSARRVRQLLSDGVIRGRLSGRTWLIDGDSVRSYVEARSL